MNYLKRYEKMDYHRKRLCHEIEQLRLDASEPRDKEIDRLKTRIEELESALQDIRARTYPERSFAFDVANKALRND